MIRYQPNKDEVFIDVGPSNAWIIPRDGSAYQLSGSFTVPREPADHPRLVWDGTLELRRSESQVQNEADQSDAHELDPPIQSVLNGGRFGGDPVIPIVICECAGHPTIRLQGDHR